MDSGNSGSLQSSSGAEDECDSRATVRGGSGLITTLHQPHQPPPFNHLIYHHDHINNTNPLLFSSSSSSSSLHHVLNLDHSPVWSNALPSFSDQINVSSKIPVPERLVVESRDKGDIDMTANLTPNHVSVYGDRQAATSASTNPLLPTRNPKKRSRASRRAPTTVLTTDTHNFRAMVQEFTGIPSSPFASPASGFPSLDLFNRPSTLMRSNNTNNFDHNLNALPSYVFQPKQYSNSLIDSCNLLNTMQNPMISFPYNPLINQSQFLNLKPTQNPNPSNGFGVSGQTQIHEHQLTLPDLLSTAATPTTTSSRNDDPVASWDGGGGDNYNNGKDHLV